MFQSVTIRNFQRHRFMRIAFDPRITVITGKTDAGKSAVIRALRWLCFSRPSGRAFVRDGAASAKVSLRVDGRRIVRSRGMRGNSYQLDGKAFRALGSDVPDEIAQLLNLGPTNIQQQHDSPYLLSLTPGQVARELNSICDLEVIDRCQAGVSRALRTAETEVVLVRKRLAEAQAKRRGLAWVLRLDLDLSSVEAKVLHSNTLTGKRDRLATLVSEAAKAGRAAQDAAAGLVDALQVCQVADLVADYAARRNGIHDLVYQIDKVYGELANLRAEAAKVQSRLAGVRACPLCGRVLNKNKKNV